MESAQVDRLIEGIEHIRHCASNALQDIGVSPGLTENYLKLIMLKCDEYLASKEQNDATKHIKEGEL